MERIASPFLPVVYFLAALVICGAVLSKNEPSVHHIVGMALLFVFFPLWITARLQLGRAFSQRPKAKLLVTTGLYSKVRHPLYVCQIGVLAGLTIFFWNIGLLAITLLVAVFWLGRRRAEEKLLQKSFGKQYSVYKQRTWF